MTTENVQPLSTEKLEEIEKKLLEACEAMQAKGFKIRDKFWGCRWDFDLQQWFADNSMSGSDCCCPQGALLLTTSDLDPFAISTFVGWKYAFVAYLLGTDINFSDGFVGGFDGYPIDCRSIDPARSQGHQLGQKFRKRFVERSFSCPPSTSP